MSIGGKASAEKTVSSETENTNRAKDATTVSQLEITQEGIDKIVEDILGSSQGLAAIFSGEQSSGLYNSSTAAGEAGDLSAKVVGEIAKLTGRQVTRQEEDEATGRHTVGRQEKYATEVEAKYGI